MTRLLVTGARGQVGSDVLRSAARSGVEAQGFGSTELDITDPAAVRTVLSDFAQAGPGVVVNAAAYTAVDAAESDRDGAILLNATAPGGLAEVAAELGLGLIHLSTDYVFPGTATSPYEVDDATGPRSVYGESKLAGELAVLAAHTGAHVVRTAWVYGATGANFVKTMAMLESTRETLSVVDDQIGSPTWAADLADGIVQLALAAPDGGILHATGSGQTTWFEFAREIFAELGADPERVQPTTSDAFPRPAQRPSYSVLSDRAWRAAGLTPLPDWRQALATAFAQHGPELRPAG